MHTLAWCFSEVLLTYGPSTRWLERPSGPSSYDLPDLQTTWLRTGLLALTQDQSLRLGPESRSLFQEGSGRVNPCGSLEGTAHTFPHVGLTSRARVSLRTPRSPRVEEPELSTGTLRHSQPSCCVQEDGCPAQPSPAWEGLPPPPCCPGPTLLPHLPRRSLMAALLHQDPPFVNRLSHKRTPAERRGR